MLDEYIDWYRASMALAYLVIDVYMLCLWSFAFRRTGLGFLPLLVITNVLFVLVSLVHVVITLTEEKLKMDVFGFRAYANFAHTEYVVRPFISVGFTSSRQQSSDARNCLTKRCSREESRK